MNIQIVKLKISYEEDAVIARQRARQIAELLGFDTREQTAIATSVSEIVRNTLNYANEGSVQFSVDLSHPQFFLIQIKDEGPGIKDLNKILEGKYKSTTGLGIGITGSRRLMDLFKITSSEGNGTTVLLGKKVPEGPHKLKSEDINKVTNALLTKETKSPIEEIKQQNQELLSTIEDVKKKQEELIRVNQELEDTNRGVVALYAELDERAEHLSNINKVKAQFISNMSHEFKTPLNSIIALTRLLLEHSDGPLNEEQTKQMTFIQKSASDLSEMVSDLLDIAKVESGKITVKPVQFSVTSLFATLRGMMRPLIINSKVKLIFEEPVNIPVLHNDDGKIAQVLRNFISNSLKFTEEGEVRIKAALDETRDNVVFSVSDTGIGIAKENFNLIFEEFSQIDNNIQKHVKGTGLGLSLSKKLIELIGGYLKLESQLGVGSTFYAVIPINYPSDSKIIINEDNSKTSLSQQNKNGIEHLRQKMLIIDDEEISRYILKEMVQNESFDIIEAENGKVGIEQAVKLKPDIILLDIFMPEQNGFQVIEILKEKLQLDIPVIIMTSKDLDEEEKKKLNVSASGFLPKANISKDEVINKIKTILQNKKESQ